MKRRILFIIALFTFQLQALNQEGVHHYVKQYIEKKTKSPVANIETLSTYTIQGAKGWEVYFLSLKVDVQSGRTRKKRTVSQIAFTKGNKLAFSLKDKSGQDYKNILKPKVPLDAYDSEHLLVGNKNAKHKILILSDPFCPYCQEITPQLIDDVKAHPNTFALYYYHLPLLRIHPASDTATRAMLIFQKRGDIEHLKEMYHLVVNPREINADVVLKAIKDKTGVQIKRVDIYSSEINNALATDKILKKRLMVTGTPTIFIDGIWDSTRMAYKNYLKK
jgi:protein-disulfide isomerase